MSSSSSSNKSRLTSFLEKTGLKERDPKEQLKEWTREIRKEQRLLDRRLRELDREEVKMRRDLKALAKKGEKDAMVPLAKSLVHIKNSRTQIHIAKANMNSVLLELRHQAALVRMSQCLEKSTKVMASMNKLTQLKLPAMQQLAYEMEKAGLIEETLEDTMEGVFEVDEDETDLEVDKVLAELTMGILSDAPVAPTSTPVMATKEELAETGRLLLQRSLSGGEPVGAEDDLDRRLAELQA